MFEQLAWPRQIQPPGPAADSAARGGGSPADTGPAADSAARVGGSPADTGSPTLFSANICAMLEIARICSLCNSSNFSVSLAIPMPH